MNYEVETINWTCLSLLMQDKDQEQFTKQLLYYLGGFAGGIPVSTLLHFIRYSSARLCFSS